jgi:copper chaperone CopZ
MRLKPMKRTFRIPDMHCTACVMRLESIEDEIPGVIRIDASYHKQQIVVEFDEKQVDDKKIIAAVKAKGYNAVPMSG